MRFVLALLLALVGTAAHAAATAPAARWNVVFIVIDDLPPSFLPRKSRRPKSETTGLLASVRAFMSSRNSELWNSNKGLG